MYPLAFVVAVTLVLELEGGLVHHPEDPGGMTKYGISQRAYPNVDIANLTKDAAIAIYFNDYWVPVSKEVLDPRTRILVFDSAVNHGLARALSWYRAYPDFNDYLTNRIRFFTNLDSFATFGRGWMRRVAEVVDRANRQAHELQRVEALVDNRGLSERLWGAIRGISGPIVYRVRPMTSSTGLKMDIDAA
jgi:lysozyme family protein